MHLRGITQVCLGQAILVEALAVPDRDAVAPPELTADAPIPDVLEPVQVNFAPTLGVEADMTIAHGGLGFLDARIAQPPLPREARLDRHISALGETDVVGVAFLGDQSARGLE